LENKTYKPVVYSDWCKAEYFPEFNWKTSIHIDSFCFADTTPYKVFLQIEPPCIRNIQDKLIQNKDFYDLILAWHPTVLGYCGNAMKFPFGGCWCQESDTSKKAFQASFLVSSKVLCAGHTIRQMTFDRLPETVGNIRIAKIKTPPKIDKRDALVPFQYSVVMENARLENWFTEKLIDCFMTKTIPIYWGAPNIAEYFNMGGILTFTSYEELFWHLQALTPAFYESRKAVIEDNYARASQYTNLYQRVHDAVMDAWNHPEKVGKWRVR
jgi:hypothetical protein